MTAAPTIAIAVQSATAPSALCFLDYSFEGAQGLPVSVRTLFQVVHAGQTFKNPALKSKNIWEKFIRNSNENGFWHTVS